MSAFGWSLPAGVGKLPGEEDYFCPCCGEKNFEGVMDDSWPEGLPGQDEFCSIKCAYAHACGYQKKIDEHGNPTKDWVTIEDGRDAVDAYGHITWSIGSTDDFICFDHCRIGNFMVLESVLNSETGSFIQTFEYYEEDLDQAADTALYMVDNAYGWCYDNRVKATGKRQCNEWIKQVKADAAIPMYKLMKENS